MLSSATICSCCFVCVQHPLGAFAASPPMSCGSMAFGPEQNIVELLQCTTCRLLCDMIRRNYMVDGPYVFARIRDLKQCCHPICAWHPMGQCHVTLSGSMLHCAPLRVNSLPESRHALLHRVHVTLCLFMLLGFWFGLFLVTWCACYTICAQSLWFTLSAKSMLHCVCISCHAALCAIIVFYIIYQVHAAFCLYFVSRCSVRNHCILHYLPSPCCIMFVFRVTLLCASFR